MFYSTHTLSGQSFLNFDLDFIVLYYDNWQGSQYSFLFKRVEMECCPRHKLVLIQSSDRIQESPFSKLVEYHLSEILLQCSNKGQRGPEWTIKWKSIACTTILQIPNDSLHSNVSPSVIFASLLSLKKKILFFQFFNNDSSQTNIFWRCFSRNLV